MTTLEIITAIKDVLLGLAAATTATAAVLGLTSWSRELRGKSDFESARALIKATCKLRNELRACRSPLIRTHEFPDRYEAPAQGVPHQKTADAWRYVYKNRSQPLWSALQEFDVHALEAEALWGISIRNRTGELRQCVKDLIAAMEAVISNEETGGENFGSDKEFAQHIRSTISVPGKDENDQF